MSIEGELRRFANEAAACMEKRAAKIHREYLEAQNLATQKKAEFEFATRAVERAFHFKIKVGSEYFCPLCGVEGDISARLRAARLPDGQGVLRCDYGHDWPLD